MSLSRSWRWLFASVALVIVSVTAVMSQAPNEGERRGKAQTSMRNGNWRDAYDNFRVLCLDEKTDPKAVAQDLAAGVQCLQQLARANEIDEFIESTIKVHGKNWRLLKGAGDIYLGNVTHYGYMIAGKFERGDHRGGGTIVSLSLIHI